MTTPLRYSGPPNNPHYELLRVVGQSRWSGSDFDIRGDRDTHRPRTDQPGARDEFGFGVAIVDSERVRLSRFNADHCWGDGVLLDYKDPSAPNRFLGSPRDVTLREFSIRGNRRNGVSIVAGERIRLLDGLIEGNRGVPEQAGIDLEPESHEAPVDGVYGRNLILRDNGRYGILAGTPAHVPIRNVHFDHIEVEQTGEGWALWLLLAPGANLIQNSVIRGPCVHLHNVDFSRVRFYSEPHYPFAIDVHVDMPLNFYSCWIDDEPMRADHPKVRLLGSGPRVHP